MATYVNDLRLTELATGEGSGTWGVTTNLNLELIGEALGYGTQDCFASDADATTTVADGASDPARAIYFKVTSSATLTATRTLTIAPNTMTRVMLIENATTGSQSIAISQGSGGNVTIASGQVKMVYLDGAGAGAAVVDALADLELGTITVANLTATTADINGGTIDGVTLGGSSQVTITDADMNGGTIDGVTIGGSSAGAITGTTGQFNTSLNVDGTVTADGLTVDGTAIIDSSSNTPVLRFDESGSAKFFIGESSAVGGGAGYDLYAGTGDGISLFTNASEAMRITSAGNVGISNSSPSAKLDIVEATSTTAVKIKSGTSTNQNTHITMFNDNDGGTLSLGVFGSSATTFGTITATDGFITSNQELCLNSQNASGAIKFGVGSTPTERMRIDSAGNVGIGTTSPAVKLHVAGETRIYPASGTAVLRFGENTTEKGKLSVDNTSNMVFETAGSERARIDSSGNLVVGVPSAVYLSRATFAYDPATTNGPIAVDTRSFAINRGAFYYMGGKYNTAGNYRAYAGVAGLKENGTDGNSAGYMAFYTNGNAADPAERARIDSSGALLVGTADSGVTSGTGIKLLPGGSNIAAVTANTTNATATFSTYSTGASAFRFYVADDGTVYATNTSITAISDASLKENIRDLDKGLDTILALKPRRFDWKNGDGSDIMGFVAQEVQEALPELVHDFRYNHSETKLGLKMGDMIPSLVKAIQEQQEIINDLRARVAQLEGA